LGYDHRAHLLYHSILESGIVHTGSIVLIFKDHSVVSGLHVFIYEIANEVPRSIKYLHECMTTRGGESDIGRCSKWIRIIRYQCDACLTINIMDSGSAIYSIYERQRLEILKQDSAVYICFRYAEPILQKGCVYRSEVILHRDVVIDSSGGRQLWIVTEYT
jgi:hypothetical protein